MLRPIQKTALVTGASSGIGAALCQELVTQGWFVIGLARSEAKLASLASSLGKDMFMPLTCDVADLSSIQSASDHLLTLGIVPTLFFLNAGLAGHGVLESENQFDLAIHQKVMSINYFGVLAWVDIWQKACMERGGAKFVVTGSVSSFFASPRTSAYAASKAAIGRAFEGLALTYAHTNLRFAVIYAGPVKTEGLIGNFPFTWTPEKMAHYIIQASGKKRVHFEPSWLYSSITRLANLLPFQWVSAILSKH